MSYVNEEKCESSQQSHIKLYHYITEKARVSPLTDTNVINVHLIADR